jgi:hypothetical protein
MRDREFIEGKLDTGFISRFNERRQPAETGQEAVDIAIIAASLAFNTKPPVGGNTKGTPPSRWVMSGRIAQLSGRSDL